MQGSKVTNLPNVTNLTPEGQLVLCVKMGLYDESHKSIVVSLRCHFGSIQDDMCWLVFCWSKCCANYHLQWLWKYIHSSFLFSSPLTQDQQFLMFCSVVWLILPRESYFVTRKQYWNNIWKLKVGFIFVLEITGQQMEGTIIKTIIKTQLDYAGVRLSLSSYLWLDTRQDKKLIRYKGNLSFLTLH